MKKLISILSLATLWPVGAVWAQLAPVNEMGLSWGHLHLTAPDMEKESKAWLALGGQLGLNVSTGIPITFPGILVSLRQGEISGGSEGSIVDHVAFRVPDLQASIARWHGPTVVGKVANWGLKTEPGTRPGQGFVTTPSLVKIEILEDKALKVPIAFDHAHFYLPESQLREIEDFYVKRFGATPVKGETDTLSLPGGKLIFSKSDKPTAPTMGRSLDHIGFNMANAEALAAFSKGLEAKGVKFYRPYTNKAFGAAMVFDGFGTLIELTKGQRGYFDINDLEPGFYKFDAQGNPRQ